MILILEGNILKEIIQFSSYLSIPEIITNSSKLRESLLFLGKRNEVWNKFLSLRKIKKNTLFDVFLHDFSRIRWGLHGENLGQTIHAMRLYNNFGMILRPVIPLVASRRKTSLSADMRMDINEQVRLYPSSFCEYRLQVTPHHENDIDVNYIGQLKQEFRDNFSNVQYSLSLALFGDGHIIQKTFSDIFTTTIKFSKNPSGSRISYQSEYPTSLKISSTNAIIETSPETKRLFLNRVRNALSLAFAYRVVVPSLWTTFINMDLINDEHLRELIEIIFIDLSPRYYLYSKKLDSHILPHSYQRKSFEVVYQELELGSIDNDTKKEFIDWLLPIPLDLISTLLNCSKPLRGELSRTLRKIRNIQNEFNLSPPTSTVFRYLTFAYLRDRYLMIDSPETYRFSKSRVGLRTANQILIGSKKIEDTFEIKQSIEKNDIYKVPGRILRNLMEFSIIVSEESQKTNAPMAFRIDTDSPTAIRECIKIQGDHEIELVNWLGI